MPRHPTRQRPRCHRAPSRRSPVSPKDSTQIPRVHFSIPRTRRPDTDNALQGGVRPPCRAGCPTWAISAGSDAKRERPDCGGWVRGPTQAPVSSRATGIGSVLVRRLSPLPSCWIPPVSGTLSDAVGGWCNDSTPSRTHSHGPPRANSPTLAAIADRPCHIALSNLLLLAHRTCITEVRAHTATIVEHLDVLEGRLLRLGSILEDPSPDELCLQTLKSTSAYGFSQQSSSRLKL
jgi:hypothetical protein